MFNIRRGYMNINFELYKIFYEVALAGSISGGAKKLMISQPAVTQAIHNLEDELGGKLFIRIPKGVIFTNEGRELFEYVSMGIKYFVNGVNKFSSLKELDSGVINIGATTTISECFLLPYLKRFRELYPNIVINIVNDLSDNLISLLRNGSVDIVFTSYSDFKYKDVSINYICELNDMFFVGKGYKKNFDSFEDIVNDGILVNKRPSVTRVNFDIFMDKNAIDYVPKMEIVSHGLLVNLVKNNFGVGLLTKEFVENEIDRNLFYVEPVVYIPKRKLGYVLKNDFCASFAIKEFVKMFD